MEILESNDSFFFAIFLLNFFSKQRNIRIVDIRFLETIIDIFRYYSVQPRSDLEDAER